MSSVCADRSCRSSLALRSDASWAAAACAPSSRGTSRTRDLRLTIVEAIIAPSIPVPLWRRIGQGLSEDSSEAARWLLGLDDVVVLVDAYNVTMATWPDLSPAEQRRILERTLVGLGGRTGARFTVIYDGGDVVADTGPRPPGLDVRFTAADIEADDEILRLVDAMPGDRPVVVVSDDRRVRDGAAARGANVVGSRQLRPLLLA